MDFKKTAIEALEKVIRDAYNEGVVASENPKEYVRGYEQGVNAHERSYLRVVIEREKALKRVEKLRETLDQTLVAFHNMIVSINGPIAGLAYREVLDDSLVARDIAKEVLKEDEGEDKT